MIVDFIEGFENKRRSNRIDPLRTAVQIDKRLLDLAEHERLNLSHFVNECLKARYGITKLKGVSNE